jgi:hypothetical protein
MVFPKDGRAEIAALVASVERHLVSLINHSGGKRLDENARKGTRPLPGFADNLCDSRHGI